MGRLFRRHSKARFFRAVTSAVIFVFPPLLKLFGKGRGKGVVGRSVHVLRSVRADADAAEAGKAAFPDGHAIVRNGVHGA